MNAIQKILVPTDFSAPADEAFRVAHTLARAVGHEVIVADRPRASHILTLLDKLGCDLIVMGTHGHSWLKHRLFGSVTEEVVRRAQCPVMVVKAPAQQAVTPAAPGLSVASGGGTTVP